MTDWRNRLRDADRALDRELKPEAAQRLRRSVLASASSVAPGHWMWSRTFAATAAALTLVCAGLLTALQGSGLREPVTTPATDSAEAIASAPERQQLHFSTPGGTRIIWVFDPGFEVKGTLP